MRGTAFYCYSTQPSIDAFVAFLNNQPVRFFFAFDRTHYGYWFFFFHGLTCSTGGFLIFKTEHDGRLKVCGTLVSVGCYYLRCWRGHVEQQWAESRSTRLFFFLSLCLFVFPGIIKPQFHRLFPASFTCHYHAHYGPPSRYLHLNFFHDYCHFYRDRYHYGTDESFFFSDRRRSRQRRWREHPSQGKNTRPVIISSVNNQ